MHRRVIFSMLMLLSCQCLVIGNAIASSEKSILEGVHKKAIHEDKKRKVKPRIDKAQVIEAVTSKEADIVNRVPKTAVIVNKNGLIELIEKETEDGMRAVAGEWIVLVNNQDLRILERLSIDVIERTEFSGLGVTLIRFKVAEKLDTIHAMEQMLPAHLVKKLSRNYIYEAQLAPSRQKKTAQNKSLNLRLTTSVCDSSVKVGIIDTAVEANHKAFSNAQIIQKNFVDKSMDPPKAHGTAVAGLLVGKTSRSQPLLTKATLYTASVFHPRNQFSQGATLMRIVEALNWQVEQGVIVINMSLTGPPNSILKEAVDLVHKNGIAIIAAAGNEGPASPALYPAAYRDVIAVTAVNQRGNIYRWANQGKHIDFAALGVSVPTVRAMGQTGRESGTSIAAPIVTAMVACKLAKTKSTTSTSTELLNFFKAKAKDLGVEGHDSVFGHGLLHPF